MRYLVYGLIICTFGIAFAKPPVESNPGKEALHCTSPVKNPNKRGEGERGEQTCAPYQPSKVEQEPAKTK